MSLTTLCTWLDLPRSTAYYQPRERSAPRRDHAFEMIVRDILEEYPTFGIRRVWATLRHRLKFVVNRKRVARLFKRRGWSCKLRSIGGATARPGLSLRRGVSQPALVHRHRFSLVR